MTRAEFGENLKVAWDTLRARKVRSGLTLLGIVIGVTGVIAVAAIIDGLNGYIAGKVEKMGSRTYFVTRWPPGTLPNRLPEKIRLRKYLNYEDGERLREVCRYTDQISVMATRATFLGDMNEIRHGGERVERVIVRGAEPNHPDLLPMFSVEYGRFFNDSEQARSASVVVLGAAVADSLFPRSNPLGKTVMLNGAPYEVIGIFYQDPGMLGGPGVDQFAMVPLSTFRKHNPGVKEVFIGFTARRDVPKEYALNEVTEALRRLRRVPHHAENDFEIIASDFLSQLWNQLTGAIVILTGVISSIGLLVGGVGVMNIMLISVTERTREIGIRKALGATRGAIMAQFMVESVTLCLLGGVLGIALGAGLSQLLAHFAGWQTAVTTESVLLAFGFSAAVGVVFGLMPARRAARMDPIEALRHE